MLSRRAGATHLKRAPGTAAIDNDRRFQNPRANPSWLLRQ